MLATIDLLCSAVSLISLLILHFVSPEFKPSWRMISEYAIGRLTWLITTFLIFLSKKSLSLGKSRKINVHFYKHLKQKHETEIF